MKIRTKLMMTHLFVILVIGLMLFVAISIVSRFNQEFDAVAEQTIPIIEALEDLRFAGLRIVSSTSEFGFIAAEKTAINDIAQERQEEELIAEGQMLYKQAFRRYEDLATQYLDIPDSIEKIRRTGKTLQETSTAIVALKKQGVSGSEVLELKERFEQEEQAFLTATGEALVYIEQEFTSRTEKTKSTAAFALNAIFVVGTITLLAVGVAYFYLSHAISKPITRLKEAAHKIGQGQLDTIIAPQSRDELGSLARSFNQMAENLASTTISRSFFHNIIQSMKESLIVLTPDHKIQLVNQATLDMSGYTEVNLLDQSVKILFDDETLLLDGLDNQGIEPSMTESSYNIKDGQQIPVWFSAAEIYDEHGEVEGVVCVAQDITERKQMEQSLEQALDQALTAVRLKDEILSRVSHELRTPLAIILGYTEILRTKYLKPSAIEDAAELSKTILNAARHLTDIVNLLLTTSNLEAANVMLNIERVEVKALVEELESEMAQTVQEKGLTLNIEVLPEVPPIVFGDHYRLKQVVTQLLDNAIAFTEVGSVTLRINISEEKLIVVDVADTGPGIPVEAQQYIFESFRQVEAVMTRKHGGVGLGLSIVSQLVTLMNGEIRLDSVVGVGSTFTVYLPLKTPEDHPRC